MSKKLYVGNLSFQASEEDLTTLFSGYGTVESTKIITDRDTGRSKGFGFIEMGTPEEAKEAMSNLDQNDFMSRPLVVNEAKERPPRKSFNDQNTRY